MVPGDGKVRKQKNLALMIGLKDPPTLWSILAPAGPMKSIYLIRSAGINLGGIGRKKAGGLARTFRSKECC